jgi:hypothetical protein
MKLLFTLILVTIFLTGCLLEEESKESNKTLYGVWVQSESADISQYTTITEDSTIFWIYIEHLSCIGQVIKLDNLDINDKKLVIESQNQSITLTLLSDNQIQATSTNSKDITKYTRHLGALPKSCGNDSTKQVEVNIMFEYLPELLESYKTILSTDDFSYDTDITFDMDNDGKVSVGDIQFSLTTGFPETAKTPSWQSLKAVVSYVYEASSNGHSNHLISELTVLVQGKKITLTGKSTNFGLIDNISNGTQVLVSSSYRLNDYNQHDYFPEDSHTFTSGLDTSLLEDVAGDSNISWDSTSASSNLNLTSIVDIRTIEISIID